MPSDDGGGAQALKCRGCGAVAGPGACDECLGRCWTSGSGWFSKREGCRRCGGTGICPGCGGSGWVVLPGKADPPPSAAPPPGGQRSARRST
jgi:hypothetical protein